MLMHVNRFLCVKINNCFNGPKHLVHAEYADHRMTNRHSAGMEYHNLEVGLAVVRSMGAEEIVSDAISDTKGG